MAISEPALLDRVRETLAEELRPVVDELLDDVIRAIVHERVGMRNGNGSTPAPPPTPEHETPAAKTCNTCHQLKPLDAFEAHRHKCKSCRRAEEHERVERRQAEDGNGGETAPAVATGPFV